MEEHLSVASQMKELEKSLETARRLEKLLGRGETEMKRSIGVEALENLTGEMAGYFAHVLNAVARYARLLHGGMDVKDPLRRHAGMILAHADAGRSLTRRLTSVAERGKVSLRPLNLNQLVYEMSRLLSAVMRKRVRLQMLLAAEELRVMADPAQIGRVFASLVRRIDGAMQKGGTITVLTRLLPVQARAAAPDSANGCAMLSIRSTEAAGITNLRETGARPKARSVLPGLSSVRRIIGEHRGAIRIDRKDEALEFNVYLPVLV